MQFDLVIHDYEMSGTDRGSAEKGHPANTRDGGTVI